MDYYKIGQKIRKYRKANGLSQEQLAERIGISITHMSHIETGNTKLSLPVLVKLAISLGVRTDDLLFDTSSLSRSAILEDISAVLDSCTIDQSRILKDILIAAKVSLDRYLQ